jgi:hypothetical protein
MGAAAVRTVAAAAEGTAVAARRTAALGVAPARTRAAEAQTVPALPVAGGTVPAVAVRLSFSSS